MAKKSLLPGYTRIAGGAERVRTPQGLEISDRAYKKIAREFSGLTPLNEKGQKIVSNEALAKFNRSIAPLESIARPARGRKSLRKADEALKAEAAKARLEEEKAKKAAEKKAKQEREIARKVERRKARKVKLRKVTAQGFKYDKRRTKGERKRLRAAQYDFDSYAQLKTLLKQARAIESIGFWGWGIVGIDERTGEVKTPWVDGLFDIKMNIDEDELHDLTDEFLSEQKHSYLVFLNWYVHFKKFKDAK